MILAYVTQRPFALLCSVFKILFISLPHFNLILMGLSKGHDNQIKTNISEFMQKDHLKTFSTQNYFVYYTTHIFPHMLVSSFL